MLITWAYAHDECDNGISLEFEQYEKGIAIFFFLKKKKKKKLLLLFLG